MIEREFSHYDNEKWMWNKLKLLSGRDKWAAEFYMIIIVIKFIISATRFIHSIFIYAATGMECKLIWYTIYIYSVFKYYIYCVSKFVVKASINLIRAVLFYYTIKIISFFRLLVYTKGARSSRGRKRENDLDIWYDLINYIVRAINTAQFEW